LDGSPTARVLDMGCSTGNFLRHVRQLMPDATLLGGDLMPSAVEQCRNDPALAGIDFEVMDIFAIPTGAPFDAIVVNAVTYLFDDEEVARAYRSLADALKPGGTYIGYEFVHPGDYQQTVVQTTYWNPVGLRLILRSENTTRRLLKQAGFEKIDIHPFEIPIDLPEPVRDGTEGDFITYTKRDPVTGRRVMFRGDLYQPWAHIVARL
jgi:SAM-dependent methyltransferase